MSCNNASIDTLLESAHHNQAQPPQLCGCCGDPACAFLASQTRAIQTLQADVHGAASVGQALLVRHESYVSTAEQDKTRLAEAVSDLEVRNKSLQHDNTRILSENRSLLDQLDALNNSLEESDAQIKSLTTTLQSTQQEFHRLKLLAARTEILDEQLQQLEREQEKLRSTLATTVEEERAANLRWRESQRIIAELQRQLDQVEDEARQDKKRHEELIERHKRRSDIQGVIKASRDRADQQLDHGGEVVSAFVRDILEDNTRLQLSMAELRDMLVHSQDETEQLRLQMLDAHMPSNADEDGKPVASLGAELSEHERHISQELHVHHHYHNSRPAPVRAKPLLLQRQKRRKPSLASINTTPTIPEAYGPHSASHARQDSTASSVFSDESSSRTKLWSHQRGLSRSSILSSGPSSPRSTAYCPSTILEQGSDGNETSITRPSTPEDAESEGFWSPRLKAAHRPVASEYLDIQPLGVVPGGPESRPEQRICSNPEPSATGVMYAEPTDASETSPVRKLRRAPSASSLISVSGMDIHSTFPSYGAPTALQARQAAKETSSGPVLSVTNASASSTSRITTADVGVGLRERLIKASETSTHEPSRDGFGGWLVSRWRGRRYDTATAESSRKEAPEQINQADTKPVAVPRPRAAGVNQLGALPIEEYLRRHAARKVLPSHLDSEALQECLDEQVLEG